MWVKIFTGTEEARNALSLHKPQLLMVGGLRITMVQTHKGIVAVQDFCTHNKESLSKGTVNYRDEIICPWHGHCFDLRTGRESQQRSGDLATYAIRESEEGIFIELPD
jgi:nitrite reductase/ring-hydroxylating ferredoxin subunit